MNNLKNIIETTDSPLGRLFDLFIQLLIVISIFMFSIETYPEYREGSTLLDSMEYFIVGVFTIEYFLRIAVATNRPNFIFSIWGLIDLFAILPTYLSFGVVDLRFIRIFRLLKLIRIFKLGRYSKALDVLKSAIISIKEELILFGLATIFLIYIAGAGIFIFEHEAQPEHFKSIFHSLWWAIVTLTSVGYGDIVPVTVGGKIFTFFILMLGLGVVSIPTGLLASALTKQSQKTE
jgi:voltage-gated potassium channel